MIRKKTCMILKVFYNFNDSMILCIHTVGSFSCPISEHDPWSIWVTPKQTNGREQLGLRNSAPVWWIKLLCRDCKNEFTFFLSLLYLLYRLFCHPSIQIKRGQRYTHIPNHPADSETTLMNIYHNVYVCRAVLLPLTSPIMFLSV